jgi:hypothetical protein
MRRRQAPAPPPEGGDLVDYVGPVMWRWGGGWLDGEVDVRGVGQASGDGCARRPTTSNDSNRWMRVIRESSHGNIEYHVLIASPYGQVAKNKTHARRGNIWDAPMERQGSR